MGKRSTVVVLTILGLASTATVIGIRRPTESPFVCPEVVDLGSVDRGEFQIVPKGFSVEGGTGEASTQFFVVSGDGHASGGELLLAASAEGGARETVRVAIRSHRQDQ